MRPAEFTPDGDFLLALNAADAEAPILSALARTVQAVDGRSIDPQRLARAVASSRAVTVDLGHATLEQLDAWEPVFAAAHAARVPIVFDRAHDAGAMARAIGFGIDAETVVAESLAPTPGYRLTAYGLRGELIEGVGDAERTDSEPSERSERLGSHAPLAAAHTIASPEQVSELILDQLDQLDLTTEQTPQQLEQASDLPAGSHAHYDVVDPESNWSPYDGQTATMDVNFSVDLYTTANKKYLRVRPTGSGVHPGQLKWNNATDRGYFQDKVDVLVRPLHGALHADAHAPLTDNQASSYTTSINKDFIVNLTNPPSLSYNTSQTTSTTLQLKDFSIRDDTSDRSSQWSFYMTASSGGPYNEWQDLVGSDEDAIHALPALATSTFVPGFETMYWVDAAFQGIIPTQFQYAQTLRNTWTSEKDNGPFDSYWEPETKVKTHVRSLQVQVDFGRVNPPRDGTLAYDERWEGGGWPDDPNVDNLDPDQWTRKVPQENSGTSLWHVTPYNEVRQTGNSYGFSPDGTHRGAYIEAHNTYIHEGSVEVSVWPADDDTWGVMYSMQDDENYYRAEFDKERNYARIVKVVDGVTSELTRVAAPAFALGEWHQLRVTRDHDMHRLYLNGVQVTSVNDDDSPFGTGAIALYTWGMSKVYFGAVAVRRTSEPDRNLAFGRPTHQSHPLFLAERAVDGATDTDTPSLSTHASAPYWFVDLESQRVINEVKLWGTYGGAFHIDVLDEDSQMVKSVAEHGAATDGESYPMAGVEGRFVRIQLFGTGSLMLSEVEVFGPG
ncbi:family 16 glycoside hydrolase [Enhygromyxa salina]|uniref:family 16 glycoside hydrolase n=1 Tax=Enhygromyxa salina TaxID=215803 RepID=UPI0011B20086|nr:family 16 glycoside hydrolase [Enhygromyxa salina]